jgi:hypothetical protein
MQQEDKKQEVASIENDLREKKHKTKKTNT